MCFHAEENDIGLARLLKVIDDLRMNDEIVIRLQDANASLFHREVVRPAGEQRHILPISRHSCADVCAYRARSCNQEPHVEHQMPSWNWRSDAEAVKKLESSAIPLLAVVQGGEYVLVHQYVIA